MFEVGIVTMSERHCTPTVPRPVSTLTLSPQDSQGDMVIKFRTQTIVVSIHDSFKSMDLDSQVIYHSPSTSSDMVGDGRAETVNGRPRAMPGGSEFPKSLVQAASATQVPVSGSNQLALPPLGHWKPLKHIRLQIIACGEPQVGGQLVPQLVWTWPPQSPPRAQAGVAGSVTEAQVSIVRPFGRAHG